LHRYRPGGDQPVHAIGHLLRKHHRLPCLHHGGLGHPVIELDHHVARLEALAFGDVDRNHDTGKWGSKFRATRGLPGLRRFRLNHAVGLDPRAKVCFHHRPNFNRHFGIHLLLVLGNRASAAAESQNRRAQDCGQQS
jgi:hypothetical protein